MDWPHSAIIQLIDNVKENPCLWKVKAATFKNSSMRDEAWKKIAGEVSSSEFNLIYVNNYLYFNVLAT